MGLASRVISHLFTTARNRDGLAAGLQEAAFDSAGVATAGPDPANLAQHTNGQPRRRRLQDDALQEALAQKVLHGWTQNRNQTLHPLTLNFRALDPAQTEILLRLLAFALTSVGAVDEAGLRRADAAIMAAGGNLELTAKLPALIAAPDPPASVFEALRVADLAGYSYALTMAATDQRDPTNRAFASYLAARLAISETVSRSIGRRYRR